MEPRTVEDGKEERGRKREEDDEGASSAVVVGGGGGGDLLLAVASLSALSLGSSPSARDVANERRVVKNKTRERAAASRRARGITARMGEQRRARALGESGSGESAVSTEQRRKKAGHS